MALEFASRKRIIRQRCPHLRHFLQCTQLKHIASFREIFPSAVLRSQLLPMFVLLLRPPPVAPLQQPLLPFRLDHHYYLLKYCRQTHLISMTVLAFAHPILSPLLASPCVFVMLQVRAQLFLHLLLIRQTLLPHTSSFFAHSNTYINYNR